MTDDTSESEITGRSNATPPKDTPGAEAGQSDQPKVQQQVTAGLSPAAKVGVIEPTGHGLVCGMCKGPIDRDMAKPWTDLVEAWSGVVPHFCSACETWFHPSCLPESSPPSKGRCPECAEKGSISPSALYCHTCSRAGASIKTDTQWPALACYRCGQPVSLAVVCSVGLGEIGWLVGVGVLALGAFIASLVMRSSQAVTVFTGSLAAVFALPWILIVFSRLMPFNLGVDRTAGGLDDLLIEQARRFRARPRWYRLGRAYLYGVMNGVVALVIIVVVCAILRYLTS